MIDRAIFPLIRSQLEEARKIILILGPRQVGKTTLARELLTSVGGKVLTINADELRYRDVLSSQNLDTMKGLVGGYDLVFIDEAQRIPDIGLNLKILHDGLPDLKLLVTGSSALELANQTKEPLTGRTWTYRLFPISAGELRNQWSDFDLTDRLDQLLRFGTYPEIFSIPNEQLKQKYLEELSSSYLYKDVLELSGIKLADKLRDLLILLAFQIGNQVSTNELGSQLGMSKDTVDAYIDLLEKAFVVFRLRGFSRNLRKEVTKMSKVYFYDLGVRNALIRNHNPLQQRNDVGALWENFLIAERLKFNAYHNRFANTYFWRTYTKAELDFVEERGGELAGYELKFKQGKVRPPQSWLDTYPEATFQLVNQTNFLSFIDPMPDQK